MVSQLITYLCLPFLQILIFELNTGLIAGGFLFLNIFSNVLNSVEICLDFACVIG